MELEYLSKLRYPKKSHRKEINIPSESLELAEFMGIVFGDGGINNDWQLVITLNSVADLEYSHYARKLIQRLFQIGVAVRKRPGQNAMVLVCSSSSLLDFLVSKGAVRGNKIAQEIDIPSWIKANKVFQKGFVRGLVDTDGCLFIHKHTIHGRQYHNLGLCFTSYSTPLLGSCGEILNSFGIVPHVTKRRNIFLYSYKAVQKYLDTFGTSNPRIANKYAEWTNLKNAGTIIT